MSETTVIRPQRGPQEAFLSSPADVVIYGGAAGGGKTFGLLLEPARHKDNPRFSAVFFRRTFPQITNPGGMWDQAGKIYPLMGGVGSVGKMLYRFPSGAKFQFAHLQYERDKLSWQGSEIPFIGFDELTHFTESQFFYLLTRNRSLCGVRPYVRCTTNPDADSWVADFIAWWIDQETGYPIPSRSGRVRYFIRDGENGVVWGDSRAEVLAKVPHLLQVAGVSGAHFNAADLVKSFTFIPANVYDNQILLAKDPAYVANLLAQPLIERERLLGGNWKIRAAAGKLFNRGWFKVVDAVPAGGEECRFWDFAATAKKMAGDNPDFTAGVKLRLINGMYYVVDVVAGQWGPAEVDQIFVNTCRQDARQARHTGTTYRTRWEQEPGSASIRETARLVSLLAGIDAAGIPSEGDKIQRAKPFAAQVFAGNVAVLGGREWTEPYLTHMHHQPEWDHDDIMDGSSGAFNQLSAPDDEGGFMF